MGTAPELLVRAALARLGVRYRLNVRALPGRPDIANQKKGFAIFVHGCFWHRHPGCQFATTPKTNRQFWERKFAVNVDRDRRRMKALEMRGIRVVVVWECAAKRQTLQRRLERALKQLIAR